MTWGEGAQPGALRRPRCWAGSEPQPRASRLTAPKGRAGPAWGSGGSSHVEQGERGPEEGCAGLTGAPGPHRWSEVYFVLWWLVSSVIWVNLFLALILEVADTPAQALLSWRF